MRAYKLMVKVGNEWEYVFCYNTTQGIVTAENRQKALGQSALDFFKGKFGNDEFRLCTGATCCNCKKVFVPNGIGLCRECGYLY